MCLWWARVDILLAIQRLTNTNGNKNVEFSMGTLGFSNACYGNNYDSFPRSVYCYFLAYSDYSFSNHFYYCLIQKSIQTHKKNYNLFKSCSGFYPRVLPTLNRRMKLVELAPLVIPNREVSRVHQETKPPGSYGSIGGASHISMRTAWRSDVRDTLETS